MQLLAGLYVFDFNQKSVRPQVVDERLGHGRIEMFAATFLFGDENESFDHFNIPSLPIPKNDLHDVFVEFRRGVLA